MLKGIRNISLARILRNPSPFLLLLFLSACLHAVNSDSESPVQDPQQEGLQLLKSNCFSCHHPTAAEGSRLAPSMYEVKQYYLRDHKIEEDFTQAFISFMNAPSLEKAKMKKAVEKYYLMPKLNYSEEDLQKIASYLYHHELEKPEGFEE